jgi:glycosyltransferase involved in cell wall biosynthesis
VGMALDTNGQKFRFVEAARKWGNDPDVVRALIAGHEDLAGVAARFAAASADPDSGLSIRSAHKAAAYFDFPYDIKWQPRTDAEVRKLAAEADVLHLTNEVKAYFWLHQKHKPAVLHHHGTLFRNNPGGARERMQTYARRLGLVQVVSTHDLLRFAPDELQWLPTCYDLDALEAIRSSYRRPDDGRVRVVSAPTNREIKSTDKLEAAVRALQAEGLPVDLVLVQNKTNRECLEIKATADVYFDQVGLGYGVNAVEAWGMGLPVIAGADDWTLDAMRRDFGRTLPFMVATEDTIADAIRALVVSESQRRQYAKRGRAHAAKFHAEKPALIRLAKLYAEAVERKAAVPLPDATMGDHKLVAGTFRSRHPRLTVRVGNQSYRFRENEDVVIDAPHLAQKMRALAEASPKLDIFEVVA